MCDQKLETTKRTVCPHGVTNELHTKTEIVGNNYKTTMTEHICDQCLLEMFNQALERALNEHFNAR